MLLLRFYLLLVFVLSRATAMDMSDDADDADFEMPVLAMRRRSIPLRHPLQLATAGIPIPRAFVCPLLLFCLCFNGR